MKKVICLFFTFVTILSFSACTLPESSPRKIEPPPTEPPPKEDIPTIPQENSRKDDQMVVARFNEPFQRKIGQSAELEGEKFIMTVQKVIEDNEDEENVKSVFGKLK